MYLQRLSGAGDQLPGYSFPFRYRRSHLLNEPFNRCGEFRVTLGEEHIAGGAPAAFDFFSGLDQL